MLELFWDSLGQACLELLGSLFCRAPALCPAVRIQADYYQFLFSGNLHTNKPESWHLSDRKQPNILDVDPQSLGTGFVVLVWPENYILEAVPHAGTSVHLNNSFFNFQSTVFWQRILLLLTMPGFFITLLPKRCSCA